MVNVKRWAWTGVKISLVLAILIVFSAGGMLIYFLQQPMPELILPLSSEIYAANGELVSTFGLQRRFEVHLDEIPTHLLDAIVAIEDHRFVAHWGIDLYGIARAIWTNIRTGGRTHGASTITQQLARNAFGLTQEKLYSRKLEEMVLALQLERHYTKSEILNLYLNTIYFGHGVYGIEAAAKLYFGKTTSELSLAEAALLAGLVRGPEYYTPYAHPERALAARNTVLQRMYELGYLSEQEARGAREEPIVTVGLQSNSLKINHFRNAVIHYITTELFADDPDMSGHNALRTGGLKIYTTMDIQMQEAAERAVARWDEREHAALQVAMVALDPQTGQVKAIVGSRNLRESTWIRAFATRQPGSAFKPFLYVAAIESQSYTAASILVSEYTEFERQGQEPWVPTEYIEGFFGPLTMRSALAKSSNVAAIQLNYEMADDPFYGPWSSDLISYARRMGITSPLHSVLSLPLGVSDVSPLELAAAYAPLANGGFRVEPYYIAKIVDRDGRILLDNRPKLHPAIDPSTAYIVTDMLKDVLQPGGTASHNVGVNISRIAAGKTGTSQDRRDGWFIGYTPDIVSAVWTGEDLNRHPIDSGGGTAGSVWVDFINEGLAHLPNRDFPRPSDVVEATIDPTTGQLATSHCPTSITEIYIAGTEPLIFCLEHPEPLTPFQRWWEFLFPGSNRRPGTLQPNR